MTSDISPLDGSLIPPKVVSNAWHFHAQGKPYKLLFRNCLVSGRWHVILNGEHKGSGQENVYNRKFYVTLASMQVDKDLRSGIIELDGSNATKYKVTFNLNNEIIPENRTRLEIAMDEEISLPVSAEIVSHRLQSHKGKSHPRTYYKLCVKTSKGHEYYIERRFSEFSAVNHLIRSQTSKHLKPSLPKMPSKVYNPWLDQSADPFIQQRKGKLQLYIGMLLGNKKIVHYQDVLYFFGLDYLGNPLNDSIADIERLSERPTEAMIRPVFDCVATAPILSGSWDDVQGDTRNSAFGDGLMSPTYSDDEEQDAKPIAIPPHIINKDEDVFSLPTMAVPSVDSIEDLSQSTTENSQIDREEDSSKSKEAAVLEQVSDIDISGPAEASKSEDNGVTINSSMTSTEINEINTSAVSNDTTTNGMMGTSNKNQLEAVEF